ncbi:MAG: transporter, major facilitator family [Candidatus Angelobacter sp.]|jgi:FHS family glucose/mannose:H+ symporter-like MFS transporter|nr:transporter, major facilitator family [Candidatus Angelobacter sp.]
MATAAISSKPVKSARTVMVLLYISFALTGVLTALPGPLLPILLKGWALTDSQGGSIIAAQFFASMTGALFANRNLRTSLLLGLVLMAVGTFGLAILPWPHLRIAVACYGLGLGMTMPAINLTIAARYVDSRAASLSVLNCIWGVGAISCPALVFVAKKFASTNSLLMLLSVILAILVVSILRAWKQVTWIGAAAKPEFESGLGRQLSLQFLALLFFLYVGAETCIASWINIYAQRLLPNSGLLSSSPVACFWAALLIGRSGSPRILKWISEERLYVVALMSALVSLVPILWGRSPITVVIGATLCGLALAPVFPLLISFASAALLSKPNSGWVFACAGLGGAVLPWATGAISTAYQLRIALLIPAAAISVLFLSGLHLVRYTQPTMTKQLAIHR